MSALDMWLDAPYQDAAAAQERAEYIAAHTCCDCGEVVSQELDEDEPCLSCCARECAA
jgi:hypothetical protein